MKQLIQNIDECTALYRDDKNGITWIEDGHTGLGVSIHPSIDVSGSVKGMKRKGFWKNSDRTVKSHGRIYNIDILVYDKYNEYERIVYDTCGCAACRKRRQKESEKTNAAP